jgi:hypothetical protein
MDGERKYGRDELEQLFKNGRIPSEKDFESLIGSTLNLKDDGLLKDPVEGLVIKPMGESDSLITFYSSIDDSVPFFGIKKIMDGRPALEIAPTGGDEKADKTEKAFVFQEDISLGINQKPDEGCKLSVKGIIGTEGRIGTLIKKKVPANGIWHDILLPGSKYFDGCQILEIVARAGKLGSRKYAVMHALALTAFGGNGSHPRIRRTGAHFGFFWNRIRVRWRSVNVNEFCLQVKTSSNYGTGATIEIRICKLWDDLFCDTENDDGKS